jgi:hypothetical protein
VISEVKTHRIVIIRPFKKYTTYECAMMICRSQRE